jgi:ssDNA-binding Zn-finger/Zn-ribbon topoisomerase 1
VKEMNMTIFSRKPTCPYCKNQLETVLKRKAKCPHCGQLIYIRKGEMVTEDDAQILDWLVFLDKYGITKQQIESTRNELSIKLTRKASARETIWHILNSLIATEPIQAYYEMARFASQEGKDAQPYIEQALRTQLNSYKHSGIKTVRVVCYGAEPDYSTCPECRKLHRKKFSIDEAIEKMPVPRSCTGDWCRCGYEPS